MTVDRRNARDKIDSNLEAGKFRYDLFLFAVFFIFRIRRIRLRYEHGEDVLFQAFPAITFLDLLYLTMDIELSNISGSTQGLTIVILKDLNSFVINEFRSSSVLFIVPVIITIHDRIIILSVAEKDSKLNNVALNTHLCFTSCFVSNLFVISSSILIIVRVPSYINLILLPRSLYDIFLFFQNLP